MASILRLLIFTSAIFLVLFAQGCAGSSDHYTEAAAKPPPDGAVPYLKHVYMVPASKDSVGCQMYTPWSAVYATSAAIYWRTRDGEFTLHRALAECPPPWRATKPEKG